MAPGHITAGSSQLKAYPGFRNTSTERLLLLYQWLDRYMKLLSHDTASPVSLFSLMSRHLDESEEVVCGPLTAFLSEQRRSALHECGWYPLHSPELSEGIAARLAAMPEASLQEAAALIPVPLVQACVAEGDIERAAAVALLHGFAGPAVQLLTLAAQDLRQRLAVSYKGAVLDAYYSGSSMYAELLQLTAMAVAGCPGPALSQKETEAGGSINSLLRAQRDASRQVWLASCRALMTRIDGRKHPYLKVVLTVLIEVADPSLITAAGGAGGEGGGMEGVSPLALQEVADAGAGGAGGEAAAGEGGSHVASSTEGSPVVAGGSEKDGAAAAAGSGSSIARGSSLSSLRASGASAGSLSAAGGEAEAAGMSQSTSGPESLQPIRSGRRMSKSMGAGGAGAGGAGGVGASPMFGASTPGFLGSGSSRLRAQHRLDTLNIRNKTGSAAATGGHGSAGLSTPLPELAEAGAVPAGGSGSSSSSSTFRQSLSSSSLQRRGHSSADLQALGSAAGAAAGSSQHPVPSKASSVRFSASSGSLGHAEEVLISPSGTGTGAGAGSGAGNASASAASASAASTSVPNSSSSRGKLNQFAELPAGQVAGGQREAAGAAAGSGTRASQSGVAASSSLQPSHHHHQHSSSSSSSSSLLMQSMAGAIGSVLSNESSSGGMHGGGGGGVGAAGGQAGGGFSSSAEDAASASAAAAGAMFGMEEEEGEEEQHIEISLLDRLAFACRFLDDTQLRTYLQTITEEATDAGRVDGLLLTGLTPAGARLMRRYLDSSGDLQTAAIVGCYMLRSAQLYLVRKWIERSRMTAAAAAGSGASVISSRFGAAASSAAAAAASLPLLTLAEYLNDDMQRMVVSCWRWLQSYRELLSRLQLWHERAKLDVMRSKLLNTQTKGYHSTTAAGSVAMGSGGRAQALASYGGYTMQELEMEAFNTLLSLAVYNAGIIPQVPAALGPAGGAGSASVVSFRTGAGGAGVAGAGQAGIPKGIAGSFQRGLLDGIQGLGPKRAQMYVRCNSCKTNLSLPSLVEGSASAVEWLSRQSPHMLSCPGCRKSLPRW